MMARRITTEEEAKAALAERRRRAREELERQAELERQRSAPHNSSKLNTPHPPLTNITWPSSPIAYDNFFYDKSWVSEDRWHIRLTAQNLPMLQTTIWSNSS